MTEVEKAQFVAVMERVTEFIETLTDGEVTDLVAGRITIGIAEVSCPACDHPEAQHGVEDGRCAACYCDRTNEIGPEGS